MIPVRLKTISASLICLLLLASCAHPPGPGQLTDDDYIIESLELKASRETLVSNLHAGFRHCGVYVDRGLVKADWLGALHCNPEAPNGTVICDVWLNGVGALYLGNIQLSEQVDSTSITLRAKKRGYAGNEEALVYWKKFLDGQTSSACPSK